MNLYCFSEMSNEVDKNMCSGDSAGSKEVIFDLF